MTYCHKHRRRNCQACIDELVSLGIQADKDRIAELEAASKWHPIETAPRDGTDIFLACVDDGGIYAMGAGSWGRLFDHETTREHWRAYNKHQLFPGGKPTHWMPIPEIPK